MQGAGVKIGLAVALVSAVAGLLVPTFAAAAPGDLDPSYGRFGIQLTAGLRYVEAVQGHPDGSAVVFGSTSEGGHRVERLGPSGELDRSFGDDGIVVLSEASDRSGDVVEAADGSIYAATSRSSPTTRTTVFKLTATGMFDKSFGENGRAFLPGNFEDAIAVDGSDRLLAGGVDGIARLLGDGSVDSTWHPSTALDDFSLGSVGVDSLGRVIAAGSNDEGQQGALRLIESGALDLGFCGTGFCAGPSPSPIPAAAAVDHLNRVIVAGTSCDFRCGSTMVRFGVGGDRDEVFGEPLSGGAALIEGPGGQILSTGLDGGPPELESYEAARIFSTTQAGTPDGGFGSGGETYLFPLGASRSSHAADLALAGPSALLIAGSVENGRAPRARGYIARLSLDAGDSDLDADGFGDASDPCPWLAAHSFGGCPRLGMGLVRVRHVSDVRVRGRVIGEKLCVGQRQVQLLKVVRAGHRRVVDQKRSAEDGKWKLALHGPGRYKVQTASRNPDGVGHCAPSHSRAFVSG